MSYIKDFDEKIENEIIVLSHFPEKIKMPYYDDLDGEYEYIPFYAKILEKQKKDKGKSEEEIEKEVKKYIFEEKGKIKEQSLKKHYKIQEIKNQELEKYFKTPKLKICLYNPKFLGNGKICGESEDGIIV